MSDHNKVVTCPNCGSTAVTQPSVGHTQEKPVATCTQCQHQWTVQVTIIDVDIEELED